MKPARAVDVEVLPPERVEGEALREDEPLMRLIAHVMDNAFRVPGTRIRFGLDPILGLLPGFGDTAAAVISALSLVQSARFGLPKIVLARMATNVLVNTMLGAIPIVGDAFSFWFKSNQRNHALLQEHIASRRQSTRSDWLFVVLMLLSILAVLIGSVAVVVYLITQLFPHFDSSTFRPKFG